jgi:uridine kinase
VTFDEVLRRGVARDRAFGSAAEAERRYLTKYIPGEQRYLDEIRPRDRADVVITNEDPADPGIEIARG